jgi:glycosyltransferase involved in cell wall biosynthesis
MIHFLPIENLKERYTPMMNDIMTPLFDYVYYPETKEQEIVKGQFLDIEGTIGFKAKQLTMVVEAFQEGKVKSGDKFFVADIFYPGIESIKYMAELQDIDVEIIGYNHAGRADEYDFVRKLGIWSDSAEQTYMMVCDRICVGSEYHKKLICEYFNINPDKVYVTGCVWSNDYAWGLYPHYEPKTDQVIFPHRLSSEKGINEFIQIVEQMPDTKFIITSSKKNEKLIPLPTNVETKIGITKSEYYKLLSQSRVYLSCAFQETFGYTLREALLYKCIPVVPDRASYLEYVPEQNRYKNIEDAVRLIKEAQDVDLYYRELNDNNVEKIMNVIYGW